MGPDIAFMHSLEIRNSQVLDHAGHLCAQRCEITAYISIVCDLLGTSSLPRISVSCDGDHNGDRQ